jgi:hypothetical protein
MSRITISAAFTKGCKPRQRLPLGITESCVWSIGELIDDAALMAIVAARIL